LRNVAIAFSDVLFIVDGDAPLLSFFGTSRYGRILVCRTPVVGHVVET
jgi:hypothetical protein